MIHLNEYEKYAINDLGCWTRAFDAAQNYAFAQGVPLYIPAGYYRFTKPPSVLKAPIIGNSCTTTHLIRDYKPSSDRGFLNIVGETSGSISISDIHIDPGAYPGGVGLMLLTIENQSFSADFTNFSNLIFGGSQPFNMAIMANGRKRTAGIRDIRFSNVDIFGCQSAAMVIENVKNFQFSGLRTYDTSNQKGKIALFKCDVGRLDIIQGTEISMLNCEKVLVTAPVNINFTLYKCKKIIAFMPSLVNCLKIYLTTGILSSIFKKAVKI